MEEIKESYAIQEEIKKLQNKINGLKKKLNKSLIKDMHEDYIGQYVKITDVNESYYHTFMHVKNILHSNINSICFTFQGQGFSYHDGGYADNIDGLFSNFFNRIITKNQIDNGLIRIDILTEDQYKEEMRNMIEFMSNYYEL